VNGSRRLAALFEHWPLSAGLRALLMLIAVADAGEKANVDDPRGKFYRAAGLILKNERVDEAERLLREYLKRAPVRSTYPRPSMAHYWLGRLHQQQGKNTEAATEYEAALKLDPKNKAAQEALKKVRKA